MKKFVIKKTVQKRRDLVAESKTAKKRKKKNAEFMTMWHLNFYNLNFHVLQPTSMSHQTSKGSITIWTLLMIL